MNNDGKLFQYETRGGEVKTVEKRPVGRPRTPIEYASPNLAVFSMAPQKNEPEALKTELVTQGQIRPDEKTLIWGIDDALPLHILNAIAESPTATNCVGKIETYTKGDGFSDPELMNMVINDDGDTLWDLHCAICQYYAPLDGYSVNFKYNLKGKIIQAYNMALDSCRLGAQPETRSINCLKYNPYFGTREYNGSFTEHYPLFNLGNISKEKDVEDYKGQAYFHGTKRTLYKHYPVPKFWSGKKWIYSDAKFATYVEKLLDNGFFESVLMKVIGDPNKDSLHPDAVVEETGDDGVKRKRSIMTEGELFNKQMAANFSGVDKAGKVMAFWSMNKDQAISLEAFPTNVNPDLISGTLLETIRMIAISTDVPAILANLPNSLSSLASGSDAVKNAVEYMQSVTAPRRAQLEKFYNNILLPNFQDGPKNAKVKITQFEPVTTQITVDDKFWQVLSDKQKKEFVKKNIPGMSEIIQDEQATVDPETGEPITIEETQLNETISKLSGLQIIRMRSIANQFDKGTMTIDQAKILLKGFGLSDSEINTWLGVQEQPATTP